MASGIALILVVFLLGTTAFSDTLEAKYATSKLPFTLVNSQQIYDGNDSIYIFGSGSDEAISKIWRYSIDSDSIKEVGQLPSVVYLGSAQAVGTDVYYFGGHYPGEGYSDIVKFDTLANTVGSVGKLPFSASYQTTFKQTNSSFVYLLKPTNISDGMSELYKLDMRTYTVTKIASNIDIIGYTSVVVDNFTYIFGLEGSCSSATQKSRILVIDMEAITSPYHSFTYNNHAFSKNSQAVSDGVYTYMVDSYDSSTELGFNTHHFLRISFEGFILDYPDIENFPVQPSDSHYYFAPGAVYVNKLNRIYYFGGRTWNTTSNEYAYVDDIWYLDLIPTKNKN